MYIPKLFSRLVKQTLISIHSVEQHQNLHKFYCYIEDAEYILRRIIYLTYCTFSEGMLDATIPLKLIIYMTKEDHFVPMEMLRLKSKCLEPFFEENGMKRLYKEYVWYLQEHLLDKLGKEDNGGIQDQ